MLSEKTYTWPLGCDDPGSAGFNPENIEKVEVKLDFTTYQKNGALAVVLMRRPDPDEAEYYGYSKEEAEAFSEKSDVITVNLPQSGSLPAGTQFVDDNNLPQAAGWLVGNGVAEPTDIVVRSGFCLFRAYKFNLPEEFAL